MTSAVLPLTAHEIIEKYNLIPHPEGGYYVETFRSDIIVPTSKGTYMCMYVLSVIYLS